MIFDFCILFCVVSVPEPLCITVQVPIPLRKKVAVPVVPVRFRNTAPSNETDGGSAFVWFQVYTNLHKPTTLEVETEDLLVVLFDISQSILSHTLPIA